jgi:hypothetical protein
MHLTVLLFQEISSHFTQVAVILLSRQAQWKGPLQIGIGEFIKHCGYRTLHVEKLSLCNLDLTLTQRRLG